MTLTEQNEPHFSWHNEFVNKFQVDHLIIIANGTIQTQVRPSAILYETCTFHTARKITVSTFGELQCVRGQTTSVRGEAEGDDSSEVIFQIVINDDAPHIGWDSCDRHVCDCDARGVIIPNHQIFYPEPPSSFAAFSIYYPEPPSCLICL